MKANVERLYKDVEFLTSLTPARNADNLGSLNRAADYILSEFKACSIKTEEQTWIADGNSYRNIIATFNGGEKARLVIGAHYDVFGDQPGADDNASAVAGLLECCRLLIKRDPVLNFQIDFVAYSLEEPPYFATDKMGSYIHAKYLADNKIPVIGMICLEMIGYYSDLPFSQQFPAEGMEKIYPNTGNFIIVVGLEKYSAFSNKVFLLTKDKADIDVQIINFPLPIGLAGLSDHRSYWSFGIPAVMINDTSFLRNPHYHEKTDTIETLDFKRMAAVVDALVQAIADFQKPGP